MHRMSNLLVRHKCISHLKLKSVTTISRGMFLSDYFRSYHMIHPNSNIHIYKDLVEIVV